MADVSEESRRRAADEGEMEAWQRRKEEELRLARAVERFTLLDELSRDAGWIWFRGEVLEPVVREARDAALDVEARTAAQRDVAAQQHAFGVRLLGLLEERRAFWAGQAGLRNDE
jgi:hypothetical protein